MVDITARIQQAINTPAAPKDDRVIHMSHYDLGPAEPVGPTELTPKGARVGEPTPAEKLQTDLAQIRAANSNPDSLAMFQLSKDRGNSLTSDNLVVKDYQDLSAIQFQNKYGQDAYAQMVATGIGGHEVHRLENKSRTLTEHLKDIGVDVANAAVQTVGSLAVFGDTAGTRLATGGLINNDWAAVKVSQLLGKVDEVAKSLQSDELGAHRYVDSLRGELDNLDSAKQHDADIASGDSKLMAGLKKIGRDTYTGAKRYAEDPALIESGVSNAVGSLLVAGGAGKVGGLGEKIIAPFTGASEGGSAFMGAVQDIIGTKDEELQAQSPQYAAMRAKGRSEEDAKSEIAANAGLVAETIAAPIGVATGKIVAPFEAAPFKHGTVGDLVRNVSKEFVEEGLQGGSGQLAQNVGEKVSGANPAQDLTEDVGGQISQGAIAGAGSPLVTSGPGLTLRAAAKAAVLPFKYAVNTAKKRGQDILDQTAAESTVSPENLAPLAQQAAEQAPQVANALKTVATEQGAKGPDVDKFISQVQAASQSTPEELSSLPDPLLDKVAELHQAIGRTPNKFETLAVLAGVANDEGSSQEDRAAAGTHILKSLETNKKLFTEDFPEFLDNVPHDRDEFKQFESYAGIVNAIEQTPEIQKALGWAREQMAQPDVAPENITPKIVDQTIDMATVAPQAVNPQVAQEILHQADSGTIELSPERRRVLRAATSLLDSARLYAAQNRAPETSAISNEVVDLKQELDSTRNRDEAIDFITRQIEEEGGSKAHQTSLRDHVAGINLAAVQGDTKTLKRKGENLVAFAKSHRNKVQSLNKSIANGDGKNVPYISWNGKEAFTNKVGVGVKVGNEAQENFARRVHNEAVNIARTANGISALYPALNLGTVTVPDLALDGGTVADTKSDTKRGNSYKAASSTQAQATTLEPADKPLPVEKSPLPPTQPTREPQTISPAVGEQVKDSTDRTENSSSSGSESEIPALVEQAVAKAVAETESDRQAAQQNAEPIATEEPAKAEAAKETQAVSEIRTQVSDAVPLQVSDAEPLSEPVQSTVEAPKELTDKQVVDLLEGANDEVAFRLTTKESFPNLVQPSGRNRFHDAFKIPDVLTSRLTTLTSPLREIFRALNRSGSLISFLGHDPEYDVTGADAQNVQQLLKLGVHAVIEMKQRLNAVLTAPGKGKPSLKDRLDKGEEITRYRDLRALNIMEKIGNDYQYNQQLLESAVAAGLDWALNLADRTAPLKKDDVAQILGVDEADVSEDMVTEMNRGTSVDQAKRTLAEAIRKFWGVEENKNVRDDYTKGIPEAVAAEVLHGLAKAGLLELGTAKFPDVTEKEFGRVWFDKRSEETDALVKSLDGVHELLSDMALIAKEVEGYAIGEPVTDIDTTQLRSPMVKISTQQKQALENVQKTPYFPNHVVFDFLQALGEEAFVTLFSELPYAKGDLLKTAEEKKLNPKYWESVKGLQRQLVNSFRNVSRQMAAVKKHDENAPTFYKHHVNKLGRLQMAGLSTPQADKAAREVFMATKSTLDLSKPGDDTFLKFLETLGQGIGLKTEKETRSTIAAKVVGSVFVEGGELRPLVQELKTWLDKRGPIPGTTVALLSNAKLSMHGLHSLLAAARYENAFDKGEDLSKFETFSYLEADGKTNGPINSLMLWATGLITPDWLRAIGRGGVYFGKLGKTLNAHVAQGKDDAKDLYEVGADGTLTNMVKLGKGYAQFPEVHAQFMAFRRFLAGLDANVELKNGELTIKRGLTKNPLTITIYGSGANGIAGKVTDELLSALYEAQSKSLSDGEPVGDKFYGKGGHNTFVADAQALANKLVRVNKDGKPFITNGNKGDYATLRANVKTFLVDPMVDAINETVMGHVGTTTNALQQATQVQSIILKGMFINEITSRLATLKADPEKNDFHPGEFLSEKERQDILNNLLPFSPIINTGTQGYLMGGGETSDLFEKTKVRVNGQDIEVNYPEGFSRSLTGDLSSPAYVYGPTLAGVGAIPTLTVGSGDGQMMLNYLAQNADRVLHVFDGLNMPADAIDEFSKNVNEAVFKTWTSNENPVRATADSFAAFMQNDPIGALFPEGAVNDQQEKALLELSQTKAGKFNLGQDDERLTPQTAKEFLEDVLRGLNQAADETDVRRQLYAEFPLSVDQMASAESPFVNEGLIPIDENASLEDLADLMNVRLLELKADKAGNKFEPVDTKQVGQPDESDVRVLAGSDLPALFKAIEKQLNPTQKEMMRNAVRLLETSGYRMVLGGSAQLDAWEQVNNADRFVPGSNNGYGKIDPISKVILISNASPETIVHELLHAATIDKVRAYFADATQLSKEEREAIVRIQGLMGEWLLLDDNSDARRMAVSTIVGHEQAGRHAEAVNEFMAWVLANQHLAETAKKTKVKNPMFRVIGDVLGAIKSLLWGAPNKGARVGDNILSNLRFNTRVLMQGATQIELLKQDWNAVALHQAPIFGSSDRLTELRQRFGNSIMAWVKAEGQSTLEGVVETRKRIGKVDDAMQSANDITASFAARFPELGNMQAWSTFRAIQAALMTEIELNSNSLSRLEDIYAHVIDKVDFRENDDPNDQNDILQAQEKFNQLHGLYIQKTDPHGRSSLMSSFLALAMTSDPFREMLSKMEKPKSEKTTGETLDATLQNLGTASMDRLSILLAGEGGKSANVRDALDALTLSMVENVGDQRSYIEKQGEGYLQKANDWMADGIQSLSDKAIKATSTVLKSNKPKVVRAAAGLVNLAATMINESAAEEAQLGLTAWLNRRNGLNTIKALVSDMVGRTRENAPIVDMISKVRAEVQQTRQQFREELPKKLARAFTKAVSAAQWTSLYQVIAKTDVAGLVGRHGVTGALELVSSNVRREAEIKTLEQALTSLDGKRANRLVEKSQQLAAFMRTGKHGANLLRNAEAIAHLLGEQGFTVGTVSPELIDTIDRLVSLYAIQNSSQDDLDVVSKLLTDEKAGVEFVTSYLVGQRAEEIAKVGSNNVAKLNHYKGHIPSDNQNGGHLLIASDSEHAELVKRGYTKVSAYTGSSADRVLGKRSYYFAPVSGTAPFSQGVLQTVHQTVSGIDPETGYTVGEVMAGRIDDRQVVRLTQRQLANQRATNENLLPVWDENGNLSAFERAADVSKLGVLNRSTDLAQMIGVWRGRQVEELLAQNVNEHLVDTLHAIWEQGKKDGRQNEFVNLAKLGKNPDKVLVEAARLIPRQAVAHIKATFGPDQLWVRRDMLLDSFGERQASIGDLFTGKTRWDPKVVKEFQLIATGILGKDAYKWLVGAEKHVQSVVTNAKTLIVVKSVIVPAANIVSNMFQLLNRGVPLRQVIKGVPAKAVEINTFINRRKQEIDFEADLRAARGRNDLVAIRKLETKIQSLQDSYRRMSIWPLIEAGEFSAISDGQVTAEDLAISDGKWANFVERKVNQLPDGLRTPARYALITRDTALFQGLARSVQYGDFITKAVLYDHLTTGKKKMPKPEAVATVSEAFVNYNRLAGRSRQYLESVGLLWFWSYKLRIMKEAGYMLRHNPLRSLMMTVVPSLPVIGEIGTPQADNIFTRILEGGLGYSIGPSMGFNAFHLNPWINATR